MPGHDIIVVGASAGGVEALVTLTSGLPAHLHASVFAVLHVSPHTPSLLPQIVDRSSQLKAVAATDGAAIEPGHIYVAPPDHHLLLQPGRIRVTRGPKENRHRPSIDVLFRSAAIAYGSRVIGVVLTGLLDDGTVGLQVIKRVGGIAVAQDPEDARYPSMPENAITHVRVDYICPASEIAALLVDLVNEPAREDGASAVTEKERLENEFAESKDITEEKLSRVGEASVYVCPECHGTLFELDDGQLVTFRCRVGHSYTPEALMADHSESVEDALWSALRAMEERISLSKRMSERYGQLGMSAVARRYAERAAETERHSQVLRKVLSRDDPGNDQAVYD